MDNDSLASLDKPYRQDAICNCVRANGSLPAQATNQHRICLVYSFSFGLMATMNRQFKMHGG